MSVSLEQCIEKGIDWAVIGGIWGYGLGKPFPSIIHTVSSNFIGITFGNYMVHHAACAQGFSHRIKRMIEVAVRFFTSCLLFKVFQSRGFTDRDIKINDKAQESLFWACIDYIFEVTYIDPMTVPYYV